MATLNIINHFQMTSQGTMNEGKQGTYTDDPKTPFSITTTGACQKETGTLATATVQQLWASASDKPATFVYFHFWADQICYLQFISAATNFTIKVAAKQPFVLPGYGSLLAAANTTAITGGSEPTVAAIASIYLGNYSGSTLNYAYAVIL